MAQDTSNGALTPEGQELAGSILSPGAPGTPKVQVSTFAVDGVQAKDAMVIQRAVPQPEGTNTVLYMPEKDGPSFHEFKNIEGMKSWLKETATDPNRLQRFSRHFSDDTFPQRTARVEAKMNDFKNGDGNAVVGSFGREQGDIFARLDRNMGSPPAPVPGLANQQLAYQSPDGRPTYAGTRPDGQTVSYQYDAYGNLQGATENKQDFYFQKNGLNDPRPLKPMTLQQYQKELFHVSNENVAASDTQGLYGELIKTLENPANGIGDALETFGVSKDAAQTTERYLNNPLAAALTDLNKDNQIGKVFNVDKDTMNGYLQGVGNVGQSFVPFYGQGRQLGALTAKALRNEPLSDEEAKEYGEAMAGARADNTPPNKRPPSDSGAGKSSGKDAAADHGTPLSGKKPEKSNEPVKENLEASTAAEKSTSKIDGEEGPIDQKKPAKSNDPIKENAEAAQKASEESTTSALSTGYEAFRSPYWTNGRIPNSDGFYEIGHQEYVPLGETSPDKGQPLYQIRKNKSGMYEMVKPGQVASNQAPLIRLNRNNGSFEVVREGLDGGGGGKETQGTSGPSSTHSADDPEADFDNWFGDDIPDSESVGSPELTESQMQEKLDDFFDAQSGSGRKRPAGPPPAGPSAKTSKPGDPSPAVDAEMQHESSNIAHKGSLTTQKSIGEPGKYDVHFSKEVLESGLLGDRQKFETLPLEQQSRIKNEYAQSLRDALPKRQQLINDANAALKGFKFPTPEQRPRVSLPKDATDLSGFTANVQKESRGIVYGESHSQWVQRQHLIEQMKAGTYTKNNTSTLYMEYFSREVDGPDLDDFNRTGKINPLLAGRMRRLDEHYAPNAPAEYTTPKLLEAAHDAGINIHPLENKTSNGIGKALRKKALEPNLTPAERATATKTFQWGRERTSNYAWTQEIEQHQSTNGNKPWIALMGARHLNGEPGHPGLAVLTNATSVRIIPGAGTGVANVSRGIPVGTDVDADFTIHMP